MTLTVFSLNSSWIQSARTALLICFLFGFVGIGQLSPAHAEADKRTLAAENHITDMIAAVRSKSDMSMDDSQKQALFLDIINSYFDVDGIVRYTAGRYWRAASASEREEYKSLFIDILTASAASQFSALMELEFIPSNTVARGDKLVLVKGIITDKTGEIPNAAIAWRVAVVNTKPPRIIDIEVENVSMLKTQQDENTAIIRKNGGKFAALISELKSRQDKLKMAE